MRKILFIILMIPFLCNCSDQEYSEEGIKESSTPLAISSASLSSAINEGMTLRSSEYSNTTTFTDQSKIGVYLMKSTGYATQINNVEYDYSTSTAKWTPAATNTQNISLNNNPATVCAYYPLGAAGIVSTTAPTNVQLTTQLYTSAEDLSYANYALDPTNQTNPKKPTNNSPDVLFKMQHAYACLSLNIKNTSNQNLTFSQVKISNPNIKSSGILNISNGIYKNDDSPSGEVIIPINISIKKHSSNSIDILLVPVTTTMSNNVCFTFYVNRLPNNRTANLDATLFESSQILAGHHYNIYFNI
ncbi:MAG: fimbrillin family protein [Bacteroidota bacterium]|nr:fimbrillin family protein [Bacteroidota bacterium]